VCVCLCVCVCVWLCMLRETACMRACLWFVKRNRDHLLIIQQYIPFATCHLLIIQQYIPFADHTIVHADQAHMTICWSYNSTCWSYNKWWPFANHTTVHADHTTVQNLAFQGTAYWYVPHSFIHNYVFPDVLSNLQLQAYIFDHPHAYTYKRVHTWHIHTHTNRNHVHMHGHTQIIHTCIQPVHAHWTSGGLVCNVGTEGERE
jgi:hypothetical protein